MTLNQGRPKDRCVDELRFAHALAAGTVKQNGVAVGFPDRGQFDAARSVEAKENAARPARPDEQVFRHSEGAD